MKKEELNTETAQQAPPIKKRLLSLDALRGITVAGMILVNNAGGKVSYAPLQHSVWNGLTPCDLVFPFFLFIMGISTYISLNKFNFNVSLQVVTKILKRTFLILCIGWAIGWFDHVCEGDFLPFVHLRIPGVLQRIALCYCVISFTALFMNHKFIPTLTFILLVSYTVILCMGNGYTCDESNVLSIIDRQLFGDAHHMLIRALAFSGHDGGMEFKADDFEQHVGDARVRAVQQRDRTARAPLPLNPENGRTFAGERLGKGLVDGGVKHLGNPEPGHRARTQFDEISSGKSHSCLLDKGMLIRWIARDAAQRAL